MQTERDREREGDRRSIESVILQPCEGYTYLNSILRTPYIIILPKTLGTSRLGVPSSVCYRFVLCSQGTQVGRYGCDCPRVGSGGRTTGHHRSGPGPFPGVTLPLGFTFSTLRRSHFPWSGLLTSQKGRSTQYVSSLSRLDSV